MTSEAASLLGQLADRDRLTVFAAVVLGDRTVDQLVATTRLTGRVVARALARLQSAGLVEETDGAWTARLETLQEATRAGAAQGTDEHARADRETAVVLRAFIRNGRLMSIPTVRRKRLVVLDYLARVFEPGVRYSEKEVNASLRAFHDDVAALRRYLVDEGFLSREGGVGDYWRTGGSVDV